MTFPPQFHSGDIIEMQTTSGPFVFKAIELADPNFLEVRWDFPICPLDLPDEE